MGKAETTALLVEPAARLPAEPNGLVATLNLDGQAGEDDYLVKIFGEGSSLVNVFDTGASTAETDELSILDVDDRDDFLLRASDKSSAEGGVAFAAALHGNLVERMNYDENLESLIVETIGGEDHVTLDDNWAETIIRGGSDEDHFQVGQIFQTLRDAANANIASEDEFATIGTTRGFLSNGVSAQTTIEGGDQDDTFTVFRNTAGLALLGESGDDLFSIRSFAEEGSVVSDVKLGLRTDAVEYVGSAPVDVNGGDGDDTLRVIGTEFADNYLVTSNRTNWLRDGRRRSELRESGSPASTARHR